MEFNNLNTFNNVNYPDFIDQEMRDLLDAMGKGLVPRSKRKAVVRTNWHAPCYARNRYKVL